jgi:hypothetical protein
MSNAKQARPHTCTASALGAILLTFSCASFGLNPVLAQTAPQANNAPAGWFLAGSKPAHYRTGVDSQMLRETLPSAYLIATVRDTGGFGTLMQSIQATQYAGKRVRLRAWVQSNDVTDWAGLWMRIDKGEKSVGFDNMQQRAIRGTLPWTAYEVVLDVPADATGISFGILLSGAGQVWLNNVQFEVVGNDVATTGMASGAALPTTPVNLGFQN